MSTWLVWLPVARIVGIQGIAIPETAGAILIGGWTVVTALSERNRDER